MDKISVAVAYGGPSPEHEVSILTGLQCERVLRRSKEATVHSIYWDQTGNWHLVPAETEARDYLNGPPNGSVDLELRLGATPGWYSRQRLRTARMDFGTILSCFHGGFGEDGGIQAVFEAANIRATGGPAGAAAIGMDKLAFKAMLDTSELPSLPRVLVRADDKPSFEGPYIVKPRFGGSSIGIEVVEDHETAVVLCTTSAHLRNGAVLEPFRSDLYDLNIAFRTYPELETSMLERPLRQADSTIYSYRDKYLQGGLESSPRELPANVSEELAGEARRLAREVALVTGLTGIVRLDFLSDGSRLYINEVNSIPGAMALFLWPDTHPSERLLLDMVEEVRRQPPRRFNAVAQQGAALQSAGGIAGKLISMDTTRARSSRR